MNYNINSSLIFFKLRLIKINDWGWFIIPNTKPDLCFHWTWRALQDLDHHLPVERPLDIVSPCFRSRPGYDICFHRDCPKTIVDLCSHWTWQVWSNLFHRQLLGKPREILFPCFKFQPWYDICYRQGYPNTRFGPYYQWQLC